MTSKSPLIRCRLSNGVDAAVEFSAQDASSLATNAARAFARYVEQHGPTRYARPVSLEIQVRPIGTADASIGWYAPVRERTPVRVFVSAELLERRPPDDWTEIWTWVSNSRAGDVALDALATDVADRMRDCMGGADAE